MSDGRLIAPAEEEEKGPEEAKEPEDPGTEDGKNGDEGDEHFEEEEEVEPLRKTPSPVMPPAAEVEEHRLTHTPYRSWCDECNRGRGLGEQRGAHKGRPHTIPIVGVDFWYITSDGIKSRDELEWGTDDEGAEQLKKARDDGTIIKCLIIRCYETKCVFAHVIPSKGSQEDPYIVDLTCSDIAWLGHVKLIVKGDNENALVALINQSLRVLRCQVDHLESVTAEHSQPYDSQSNGGTEIGIRAVRGHFRTLRLCLERRIGHSVPVHHPLSAWLIEHTCTILNACLRGRDGLTPWARARGRPFGLRMYGMGESVLWKQPSKGPQHDEKGNMAPRLSPGIFIGHHKSSNSYRVIDEKGNVVKTRAINRRPFEGRWDVDKLKSIVVTPWSLRTEAAPERVDVGPPVEKHEPPKPDVAPLPRRLKITMKILNEHGFTKDCQQCDHIQRYSETKPGLTHSDGCRRRIIDSMLATPEGQQRIQQYEDRVDRAIAARGPPTAAPPTPIAAPSNAPATDPVRDTAKTTVIEDGTADTEVLPAAEDQEPPSAVPEQGTMPGSSTDVTMEEVDLVHATAQQASNASPVAATSTSPVEGCGKGGQKGTPMKEKQSCQHATRRALGIRQNLTHADDDDCLTLLAHIGVETKSFKREHKRAMRNVVSEIYSPPRVTKLLSKMKGHPLAPGFALDITCNDPDDNTPWDFDLAAKREKALNMVRETKPLFLIGSPMCTAWCSWQRIKAQKRDPAKVKSELARARKHLEFVVSLYHEQVSAGRYFLHEQPRTASSWQEDAVQDLANIPGVETITADQCQLGAEVPDGDQAGAPVRKATGFMSNSRALLHHLHRRCHGHDGWCTRRKGGKHVVVQGKLTRGTAIYSDKLCRAIIRGMTAQLKVDGLIKDGEVGINAMDDDAAVEATLRGPEQGFSGQYRDDLTNQVLRDDLVKEARRKELDYFCSKGVWLKRPKEDARAKTGRSPISVRWVDVNKGDDMNPRYRSRLVARQLKAHDRSGASYFAPTPPLEALRTVLSMAATQIGSWVPVLDPKSSKRMQISFVDIARAYFNARLDTHEHTYVALPPEDPDHLTKCARLLRHMYGTRAAADGWQEEYSSFLVETLGFAQGTSSPCVFRHPSRQLVVSVHGDDFTTAGAKDDLDWYEGAIKEKYECTIQPRLGPGEHDGKEAVVLNRIVRWTPDGIEYEADPRQAEKLIEECGLAGSNTVVTPGIRLSHDEVLKDQPLEERLTTAFRAAAARANYLAADRLDCQYAAKEVCRHMAAPTRAAWMALKRLCRYLVGLPRMVFSYKWQSASVIEVYTDTDFAGCPRTRKSTSGGCVIFRSHTIKSWSSTQTSVALSSGEAEFNGVVRGSGVGLGYQSLLRDLGIEAPVRVWTDSSAAIGICSRQGLGGVRHLDTHTLWVQQAVRCRRIDLRKVDGEVNPADIFTKHALTRERLAKLVKLFDCVYMTGRAKSAPQTRTSTSDRVTIAEANTVNYQELDPVMPHKLTTPDRLDVDYPPVTVPDDYDHDYHDERTDELLRQGTKVAEEIIEDTRKFGRRRRPQNIS